MQQKPFFKMLKPVFILLLLVFAFPVLADESKNCFIVTSDLQNIYNSTSFEENESENKKKIDALIKIIFWNDSAISNDIGYIEKFVSPNERIVMRNPITFAGIQDMGELVKLSEPEFWKRIAFFEVGSKSPYFLGHKAHLARIEQWWNETYGCISFDVQK